MLLGSSSSAARSMGRSRSRTQFNLWAILAAPLMIGANVRQLNAYDLETYLNKEVIAVNQDPEAKQGRRVAYQSGSIPQISTAVWARELADGSVAMAFVNNYGETKTIACNADCWNQLPFSAGTRLEVRDLWTHAQAANADAIAGTAYEVSIAGDGASKMFRFTPVVHVV